MVAGLEDGVRAAVDADEEGPVLADVRAQRLQVLAVVVPTDHDERVPALDPGPDGRDPDPVEEQLALLADELHRVRREGLDLNREARTGLVHLDLDRFGVEQVTRRDPRVTMPEPIPVQPQWVTVMELHDGGPNGVEQRHACLVEDRWSDVGITAGERGGSVDHRSRPRSHECVRAHLVEILVVDDGDVSGPQPPREVLRPAVHAGRTHHPGTRGGGVRTTA